MGAVEVADEYYLLKEVELLTTRSAAVVLFFLNRFVQLRSPNQYIYYDICYLLSVTRKAPRPLFLGSTVTTPQSER